MRKGLIILQLLLGGMLLLPGLARSPFWLHEAIGANVILLGLCLLLGGGVVRYGSGVLPMLRLTVFASPNRWFYGTVFLAGTLLYSAIILFVFDAMPRMTDGIAYLFQAKIFADGRLWADMGQMGVAFERHGMIPPADHETGIVGMYPPGWSAILAIGTFFNLAWLVPPILGGALACSVGLLATELHNRQTGRIAALLCLLSPMFVLLNSTYLSHTLPSLGLVLATWGTVRLVRTGRMRYGVLAGFAMGLVFLSRPVSGLLIGICIALYPLVRIRDWKRFFPGALAAFAYAALGVLTLLVWQDFVTGDWKTSGHVKAMGEDAHIGFGTFGHGNREVFGPTEALEKSRDRIRYADGRLLGWPVSACLLLAALFLWRRGTGWDLWCLLPVFALLMFFHFYYYAEFFFRARYLAEGMPFLFIPLARVFFLPSLKWRPWFAGLAVAGTAFSATVALPAQFSRYTPVYGDYIPFVLEMEKTFDLSHSLVFVSAPAHYPDGNAIPDINAGKHRFYCTYYSAGFVRNRPDFQGDIVYAFHQVDRFATNPSYAQWQRQKSGMKNNLAIMKHYEDRRVFVLEFHRGNNTASYYQVWANEDFSGFEKVEELTPDP